MSSGGASDKNPTCQCSRRKRCRFDPWFGKILWRRTWQPTPVFLPGESHGQWSLAGYSPCWTWQKWLVACTHEFVYLFSMWGVFLQAKHLPKHWGWTWRQGFSQWVSGRRAAGGYRGAWWERGCIVARLSAQSVCCHSFLPFTLGCLQSIKLLASPNRRSVSLPPASHFPSSFPSL